MATIVGLDFGASALRMRVRCVESGFALPDEPMPRLIRSDEGKNGTAAGCHSILSVKRIMDVDTSLPVPPSGQNSVEYIREKIEGIRHQIQLAGSPGLVNWVVAVPPCFSQRQRSAVRSAFINAGCQRLRLVDDTLCTVFGASSAVGNTKRVMVYSWGASTFSVAIYVRENGRMSPVVQAGDRELGGDDIDSHILSHLIRWVVNSGAKPVPEVLFATLKAAHTAKDRLVKGESVTLTIDQLLGITARPGLFRKSSITMTPDLCREALAAMIAKSVDLTRSTLIEAGSGNMPELILLTGGMTHIPLVAQVLSEAFKLPVVLAGDDAVVEGAALVGTKLPESEWEKSSASLPPEGFAPKPAVPAHPAGRRWSDRFAPLLDDAQRNADAGHSARVVESLDGLFDELAKFTAEFYRRRAVELEAQGQLDLSWAVLKRAHLRDTTNRLVAVDLARMCYRYGCAAYERKKVETALGCAEEGVRVVEGLPNGRAEYGHVLAELYYLKGLALWSIGQLVEAGDAIDESVELAPKSSAFGEVRERIRTQLAAQRQSAMGGRHLKGSDRNKPCFCGSGRKAKHCHGA